VRESKKGAWRLVEALPDDKGGKCISPYVRHILQSHRAINTTVWSKTCNLSPSSLKILEGFHIRAIWRKAGKRPMKLTDGTWTYPNSTKVLEDAGLKTIAHYIAVRRQHIANYIVIMPIFTMCVDGVRRRGSSKRHFWWEQSMDIEAARATRIAGPVVGSVDEEKNR
jgi:hypothetical protein